MTAYLHVHGIAPNFVPSLDHIGDIRAVRGEIEVDDVYNNEFVVVPDWRNFRVMGVERREPGEVKITYVTQGTAQYIGWNERDVGSGENADN